MESLFLRPTGKSRHSARGEAHGKKTKNRGSNRKLPKPNPAPTCTSKMEPFFTNVGIHSENPSGSLLAQDLEAPAQAIAVLIDDGDHVGAG